MVAQRDNTGAETNKVLLDHSDNMVRLGKFNIYISATITSHDLIPKDRSSKV